MIEHKIIFRGTSYKNRMIEIYLPQYKYSQFAIPSPLGNTHNVWEVLLINFGANMKN